MVNSFIKVKTSRRKCRSLEVSLRVVKRSARVLQQRMTSAAYQWHNYGKDTIGNRSDIERVPVNALRDFYKKYYRPDMSC